MGVIQLPDELQRAVDRQVAEGRAASPAAFLEEAIRRLIDETMEEEDEIRRAVVAGSADVEAERFTVIATRDDERCMHDAMLARLQARLTADG